VAVPQLAIERLGGTGRGAPAVHVRADDDSEPPEIPAVLALNHLAERSGCRHVTFGYRRDDPADPGWWATAAYTRDTVRTSGHPSVDAACDALAVELLDGSKCRCGGIVVLNDAGTTTVTTGRLLTGEAWNAAAAVAAGAPTCRWRRQEDRWTSSCDAPPMRLTERP